MEPLRSGTDCRPQNRPKTVLNYVTKLGAYGLGAVTAFAVALALLVSVSSTPTAEAATVELPFGDPSASAAPGDTVGIVVQGALAQVSITGMADGVGASFVANDGQSVNCGDDASCDTDDSDANTAGLQNVADQVRVALKIDDDSGEGYILVSVTGVGAGTNTATVTKVINVSKATLVGSLKITASPKTIPAAGGTSTLTIEVQNAAGTPAGLNDQDVSLVTTLGSLECVSGTETQACSVTTANNTESPPEPGFATATLNGKGVEGTATITARLGSLTETVEVTLFGTAKNLAAEPMQDSVEIGGDVYVVLTVTDGAGNPVSGQVITPITTGAGDVSGPEGDDVVEVVTTRDTPAADTTNDGPGVGYSKDFIHATDSTKNIPACGDDAVNSLTSPSTEVFETDGTNANGQCVVHVSAPDPAGTDDDATRGAHTLNFEISALRSRLRPRSRSPVSRRASRRMPRRRSKRAASPRSLSRCSTTRTSSSASPPSRSARSTAAV